MPIHGNRRASVGPLDGLPNRGAEDGAGRRDWVAFGIVMASGSIPGPHGRTRPGTQATCPLSNWQALHKTRPALCPGLPP